MSKDRDKTTRIKEALVPFAIAGFVAHEDIHPIFRMAGRNRVGLRTMDAFIAIHTEGFATNNFTQQEVGFALGRGVKIISLQMGERPTVFISRKQSLAKRQKTAD